MEYFRNRLGVGPDVHIAYLVRQGTCTQEKLQNACKGLMQIANEIDVEGLNALVKIGALQPLILLMAHRMSHNPITRAMAADCMNILSRSSEARCSVVQLGLLPSLPKWCGDEHYGLRYSVATLIGSLALDADNQVLIAKAGLCPELLKMGKVTSAEGTGTVSAEDRAKLLEAICRAIGSVALNSKNQLEFAELGACDWLAQQATAAEIEEEVGGVKQGGAPLVSVREKACMAIWNLAALEVNQHKFAELNMVPTLLTLLQESKEDSVKEQASGALANLALLEKNATLFHSEGGIESLMEMCYSDSLKLQQNAAAALSNMCLLPQVREEMVLLGGAETMLMLLQREGEELQRSAAGALMNLSLLKENREQIIKNNGIKIILQAADPTNLQKDMVQEPVSGCLAQLAVDTEGQEAIAAENGLEVIIKLANSPHLSVMLAAAEGLDHFCSNPNYQAQLLSDGGVKALQLYARKLIKERTKKGNSLARPPKPYEKAQRIKIEKTTSFISPPPRYRPVTPAALYEMEALDWWPGTEDRPLSSGDAHHASSPEALNAPMHTRPTVATAAENVFFNGEKLAKPILPSRTPIRSPTSPNPKAPMSAASASEHGAFQLQGRPAIGSSEPPRFYF